ncbi:MAG: hypothetical protein JRD47_03800 [Deltaproteobacteria bacterium]|nr:hypothetical protein [Deltaproteobacteria bacterium]MBW2318101.1 hypothetical protein [Deltaproteobacteria bacterium]MBW2601038.1 hypothetical protein [Deltaproteobacteria bacterium]
MIKSLLDRQNTYHLQNYAILENEDNTYEYVGWDPDKKTKEFSWIRGKAAVLDDILCFGSITSDGKEEAIETQLELDYELQKFPKWDKTKYFCVVLGGSDASLLKFCDTGDFAKKGTEEYKTAQESLKKYRVNLPSDDATF